MKRSYLSKYVDCIKRAVGLRVKEPCGIALYGFVGEASVCCCFFCGGRGVFFERCSYYLGKSVFGFLEKKKKEKKPKFIIITMTAAEM